MKKNAIYIISGIAGVLVIALVASIAVVATRRSRNLELEPDSSPKRIGLAFDPVDDYYGGVLRAGVLAYAKVHPDTVLVESDEPTLEGRVEDLRSRGIRAFIGPTYSAELLALTDKFKDSVFVSPSAVTDTSRPNALKLRASAATQGEALLTVIARSIDSSLGEKRIVVIKEEDIVLDDILNIIRGNPNIGISQVLNATASTFELLPSLINPNTTDGIVVLSLRHTNQILAPFWRSADRPFFLNPDWFGWGFDPVPLTGDAARFASKVQLSFPFFFVQGYTSEAMTTLARDTRALVKPDTIIVPQVSLSADSLLVLARTSLYKDVMAAKEDESYVVPEKIFKEISYLSGMSGPLTLTNAGKRISSTFEERVFYQPGNKGTWIAMTRFTMSSESDFFPPASSSASVSYPIPLENVNCTTVEFLSRSGERETFVAADLIETTENGTIAIVPTHSPFNVTMNCPVNKNKTFCNPSPFPGVMPCVTTTTSSSRRHALSSSSHEEEFVNSRTGKSYRVRVFEDHAMNGWGVLDNRTMEAFRNLKNRIVTKKCLVKSYGEKWKELIAWFLSLFADEVTAASHKC